jgi:hypothetical protein
VERLGVGLELGDLDLPGAEHLCPGVEPDAAADHPAREGETEGG